VSDANGMIAREIINAQTGALPLLHRRKLKLAQVDRVMKILAFAIRK